jgi:hypothetical protein
LVANLWLRPGNTASSFIESALQNLGATKAGLFRADSGFYDKAIVGQLKAKKISHIISARLMQALQHAIMDQCKWQQLEAGLEVCQLNYQSHGCQTTARTCTLVYNWWSWYCRTANPSARMQAITNRALLLAAVGTTANHAGQTTLYLTTLHGKANVLKALIANIHAALQHVKDTAEQFKVIDQWAVLLRYVSDKIAPVLGPFRPPNGLPATG